MTTRPATPWLKRARRTRRLRVIGRVVAVVVAALVLYVVVTFAQVVLAANRDDAQGSTADAIVVLGAAQYDGRPSGVLRARLDHAAELYEAGVAPVLVVTGGRQPGDRFTEAGAAARYLRTNGVPDRALRLEVDGESSWESLAATARFLTEEGITDVILVSSPYHALRTQLIAEEVGLTARPSPAGDDTGDLGETIGRYTRETLAVAAGRVLGYRRLVDLDERVAGVRTGGESG